ncbi:transcriptional regulator domain-containing protein [Sphingobium aquiterrae]|mgnify:CR=1 FL=1|uniref:transcriptional regulator domain-containing protein n=1 Tax=Sphingobium aquiterrae TaxID=2038656 RepID=UPI00301A8BBB
MARNALLADPLTLVPRSLPDPEVITDARAFAWEVLRRRADYRGVAAATEQIGTANAPIELILSCGDASEWGLRFRGNARTGRSRRPPDVARRTGPYDDPGDGPTMACR